jgi:hypothetical protein
MKAVGEYVIIQPIDTTTASGIITVKRNIALVISAGEEVPEQLELRIRGQTVYYANKYPTELGDGLVAVRFNEIMAVVE